MSQFGYELQGHTSRGFADLLICYFLKMIAI